MYNNHKNQRAHSCAFFVSNSADKTVADLLTQVSILCAGKSHTMLYSPSYDNLFTSLFISICCIKGIRQ